MTAYRPSHPARLVLALLAPTLALAACDRGGQSGSEWAGAVEDSAGVQIIRNPEQGMWAAGQEIELVEDLRIGRADGDPNYQFGQVTSVDVDAAGNVYVLDQLAQSVRVYDASGTYLRSLGRPGSGPGELSRAASAVLVTAGDTIAVPDIMLQRVSRFTSDGSTAGSIPMMMQDGIPLRWEHGQAGRLVVQTMRMPMPGGAEPTEGPTNTIIERDLAGTVRDTVKVLAQSETFQMRGETPVIRIFSAESIWSPRDGGGVAVALNDQYRIELWNGEGALERVIVRDVTASPVSESDKTTLKQRMGEMMAEQGAPPPAVQMMTANMQFGDRFPVLNQLMRGPDGTLWVQRVRPASEMDFSGSGLAALDMGAQSWDVYDDQGRLLGAVTFPERFTVLRVRDNVIYGVQRDDLDVPYVVRLRIQQPGVGAT